MGFVRRVQFYIFLRKMLEGIHKAAQRVQISYILEIHTVQLTCTIVHANYRFEKNTTVAIEISFTIGYRDV